MRRIVCGRYTYDDNSGAVGGQGSVFRATDLDSDPPRNVAVKVLSGANLEEPLLKTFFDREVEALLTLDHANIVELIDWECNEEGSYCLVLEWVPNDLDRWLVGENEVGWEDFVRDVALPIAAALSFAHQRQVIHRDVKPSNVLLTQDGVPKLADFGISKIKSSLMASPYTTVDFVSRPYSPPEADSNFSRDVFGFGVMVLNAISDQEISDYPDITVALAALDVPKNFADFISKCTNLNQRDRHANATLMLEDLRSLMEQRVRSRKESFLLPLRLTGKARSSVEAALDGSVSAEDALMQDLRGSAAARRKDVPSFHGEVQGRHIFIAGREWSVQGVIEIDAQIRTGPEIVLVNALEQSIKQGDNAHTDGLPLDNYKFTFEPPLDHRLGASGIEHLISALDDHADERLLDRDRIEEGRTFNSWMAQLDAREEIERRREQPIPFSESRQSESRWTFNVGMNAEKLQVGDTRRIKKGKKVLPGTGEIEAINGDEVVLWFDGLSGRVPKTGDLVADDQAAGAKIDKEKRALQALIHGNSEVVEPRLRDVVLNPAGNEEPRPFHVEQSIIPNLDADKTEAIERALGSPQMFVVEGPPGTGKTTLIAELVAQEIRKNPQARILITSQTNVALDNVLVKVARYLPDITLIRFADAQGRRVTDGAKKFLVRPQVDEWVKNIRADARRQFTKWCASFGMTPDLVRQAGQMKSLANALRDESRILEELMRFQSGADAARAEIRDSPEYQERERLKQLKKKNSRDLLDLRSNERFSSNEDGAELDELSPAQLIHSADELLAPLGAERDRAVLYVEWDLRLEANSDFESVLISRAQVIGGTCVGLASAPAFRNVNFDLCILDEASKATPTESLIPLVRSKRWVLVGDRRQLPPFQEQALGDASVISEFGLDKDELEHTLFDRMLEGLPSHSKASLTVQRRMTKAIGDLVSACFYDGELVSLGPDPLPTIATLTPMPITWWSTSGLPHHHERQGTGENRSIANPAEVNVVRGLLAQLCFYMDANALDGDLEILILAPYSEQVMELRREVNKMPELTALKIEVNTVDAVQGREADLVIYSTVRSNISSGVGFLNSDKRANVALSRARRGLIIVGDHNFLSAARSPFEKVIKHIQAHPENSIIIEVEA